MRKIFIILLFLPIASSAQFGKLVKATVVSVHDGDGCVVRLDGQMAKTTVRFRRVDAPEIRGYSLKTQPYGRESGDSLRLLIKGKAVLLDTIPGKGSSRDKYGRLLADIWLEDTTSVQFWLVERGLAWYAKDVTAAYPKMNTVLYYAEKTARADGLGLWASYPTRNGKKARIYKPSWWRGHYSIR